MSKTDRPCKGAETLHPSWGLAAKKYPGKSTVVELPTVPFDLQIVLERGQTGKAINGDENVIVPSYCFQIGVGQVVVKAVLTTTKMFYYYYMLSS